MLLAQSYSAKGNENAVKVYTSQSIAGTPNVSLSRGGMILIALLSGRDYHPVIISYRSVIPSEPQVWQFAGSVRATLRRSELQTS